MPGVLDLRGDGGGRNGDDVEARSVRDVELRDGHRRRWQRIPAFNGRAQGKVDDRDRHLFEPRRLETALQQRLGLGQEGCTAGETLRWLHEDVEVGEGAAFGRSDRKELHSPNGGLFALAAELAAQCRIQGVEAMSHLADTRLRQVVSLPSRWQRNRKVVFGHHDLGDTGGRGRR